MKKILYVSGSIGLGHVVRDLAIARELRRQVPGVEIHWLAAHPATRLLSDAGETVLPEAQQLADYTSIAEEVAQCGFRLNIVKYANRITGRLARNAKRFKQVVSRQHFDLVVGDEAYEVWLALMNRAVRLDVPFVMMFDFFGMDSMTRNPLEKLIVYLSNLTWLRGAKLFSRPPNTALFIGESEDVPDEPLGFGLPNRRKLAEKFLQFVGYVIPFDPADYADRSAVRKKLGYGQESLVVCSIGGTAVGRELLQLCCEAYPLIRKDLPAIRMLVVCGPRLQKESLKAPDGVRVEGYIPALYEHLAASDLAIVQGGGTTTLELTALKRPFLYFPLEGHFEQQVCVSGQLARHRAGVRMSYRETTPAGLAKMVISTIGKQVDYLPVPTDGARKAAQIIAGLL